MGSHADIDSTVVWALHASGLFVLMSPIMNWDMPPRHLQTI